MKLSEIIQRVGWMNCDNKRDIRFQWKYRSFFSPGIDSWIEKGDLNEKGFTWEFLGLAERSRGWSTALALSWCVCTLTWGASLGGRHHCGSNVGYVPRAAATTDAAMGSTWTDIGDSADRELLLLSLWGLCEWKKNVIKFWKSQEEELCEVASWIGLFILGIVYWLLDWLVSF